MEIFGLVLGVAGLVWAVFTYFQPRATAVPITAVSTNGLSSKDVTHTDRQTFLRDIKGLLPNSYKGLLLCEFDDGREDLAVGISGTSVFIAMSDGRALKNVSTLNDSASVEFSIVSLGTDIIVFTVKGLSEGVPFIEKKPMDLVVEEVGVLSTPTVGGEPLRFSWYDGNKPEADGLPVLIEMFNKRLLVIPQDYKFGEGGQNYRAVMTEKGCFLGFISVELPAQLEQLDDGSYETVRPAMFGLIPSSKILSEAGVAVNHDRNEALFSPRSSACEDQQD